MFKHKPENLVSQTKTTKQKAKKALTQTHKKFHCFRLRSEFSSHVASSQEEVTFKILKIN